MAFKFKHTAIGGTFDLLHKGHISLLEKGFQKSEFVSIGITTEKMIKSLDKTPYESQQTRIKNLRNYLNSRRFSKRSKIILLNDIYGTAAYDKSLQALVTSKETLANANLINKYRTKNKLKKLTLIICPQVLANDKTPISSSRIRNGEIDRNGSSYKLLLEKISNKRLSERIRLKLKKPFGKYVTIDSRSRNKFGMTIGGVIFAIGDITVLNFLKVGIIPQISIVDFYVQRERKFSNLTELGFKSANPDYIVKNEPGLISQDLIGKIESAINLKRKSIILVDGEEDLSAIPAMLLAPLGSTIFYGQPNKSAVCVNVTEKIKEDLAKLLIK